MYLWLVRHGEADYWSAESPGGVPGPGLTERGFEQARALADRLSLQRWDAVRCSDLLRARQTLEPSRERIGFEVVYDARLREVSPSVFDRSLENGNEEPVSRQLERMETFAQGLYGLRDRRVLVVAHQRVIRYVSSSFGVPIVGARCGSIHLLRPQL